MNMQVITIIVVVAVIGGVLAGLMAAKHKKAKEARGADKPQGQ